MSDNGGEMDAKAPEAKEEERKEENGAEEPEPEPTEERRSRRSEKSSRRDRDRDDRDRKSSRRDRDRDRDRRHRRSRSRSRDRRSSRRHRSRSREGRDRRDRERDSRGDRGKRDDRRKEEEDVPPEVAEANRRQRELEELDRDTRTVFAYNVNTKADEKDIFEFMSTAGTVVDVRIIMDRNSRRSKGFAYVEYENQATIPMALALSGQQLLGQVVMVKSSEAEKNMAWEANQSGGGGGTAATPAVQTTPMPPLGMMQPSVPGMGMPGMPPPMHGMFPGMMPPPMPGMMMPGAAPMPTGLMGGPCKLQISGLNRMVTEDDLKAVFEPFGPTDFLTLAKDDKSVSLGYGHVQYKTMPDATRAIAQLNGLELAGQKMKVLVAPPDSSLLVQQSVNELEDDGGDGMKLNAQSRAALMARLSGQEPPKPVVQNPLPVAPAAPAPPAADLVQGVLGPSSPIPTQCLLLKNMFNPEEETEEDWQMEITEDVKEECSKFGEVRHIFVDPMSKGFVYLKFSTVQACTAAKGSLHGRWFAGKMVLAEYQFSAVYDQHFPEAK